MALVLAGCKVNEPEQKLGLPLSICLPANEVQSARYAPAARRAIGDPGETELFLFPHYLYIIVMKQDNTTKVWSVWHAEERTLTDADWKPTRYVGLLPTMEDSIYQYTEQINLPLTAGGSKFYGRVYAVASAEPLSFNFNKTWSSAGITSLDDLLNLTFNTSEVQSSLQHIYMSGRIRSSIHAYFHLQERDTFSSICILHGSCNGSLSHVCNIHHPQR